MKLFFLVLFMLCFASGAFGQIDYLNSEEVPWQLQQNPFMENDASKPVGMDRETPSLTNPEYRTGIRMPAVPNKDEKTKSVVSTETDLLRRTMEYEPAYLKRLKDSGGKGNQSTQYLGEFVSTGKFVEVYCRDHQYVDGDRVKIMVNGKTVVHSQQLFGTFQPVLITLEKGLNRIEFEALNVGSSPPNTAEFVVYDEMGNVITQNQWNLAAGVKASFSVRKP